MSVSKPTDSAVVSGYRLLKPLGPGSCNSWLGVPVPEGQPVVVRRIPASADGSQFSIRTFGTRHGIRLLDLNTEADGSTIVIEEWAKHGAFLEQWNQMARTDGEAVTALMPLLEHLIEMAKRNMVPPSLGTRDLLLDESGRVRVRSTMLWVSRTDEQSDWSETVDAAISAADAIVCWIGRAINGIDAECNALPRVPLIRWEHLSEWLGNAAVPQPIRFPQSDAAAFDAPSVARALQLDAMESQETNHAIAQRSRESALSQLKTTFQRLRRLRRPVWLTLPRRNPLFAGIIVLVIIVGACLLFLPTDSAEGGSVTLSATNAPSQPTHDAVTETPSDATAPGVVGVAENLLRSRTDCHQMQIVQAEACLSRLLQDGAPLQLDDLNRLTSGAVPKLSNIAVWNGELIAQMGSAVIVRFTTHTKPASVLLVQTEAGWRLREVFD